MEKIQILFPEPTLKIVRRIAENEDRTISELIRKAVDQWLDRTTIPAPEGKKREKPPVFHCGSILMPPEDFHAAAVRGNV